MDTLFDLGSAATVAKNASWQNRHAAGRWTNWRPSEHVSRDPVRLFQKSVQASPLAFLADRRLTLARQRTRTRYRSESAFSRAYRPSIATGPTFRRYYFALEWQVNL